jgi:hypothetical protein
MAHEMERLLATPTISPVLLARSVMFCSSVMRRRGNVRQVCGSVRMTTAAAADGVEA